MTTNTTPSSPMQTLDRQLIKACQKGDVLTVEKLLQQGANPNAQDDNGKTPLIIATEYGQLEIIITLIQYGANPHIRDAQGQSTLHYAVGKQHPDIAQYLITGLNLDPNSQDYQGITPFLLATKNGDIQMLRLLIQLGANPHATDRDGKTALHYAVEKQYHNIAQYLIIELNLDPNPKDQWRRTPLMLASADGDIKMLRLLIQHGADPHSTNHNSQTALHYAARYGHYKVVQYLLTHLHLDPNTQDHDGITPFLIAIQNGDIKMLRLLIQHGANPYVIDKRGRNALHHAAKKYRLDAVEYLITRLKLNPNAQDHDGYTPLLIATEYRDQRIAKTLSQHGANPHIPNHQGQPPTAIARQHRIPLDPPQPSTITL